MCCHHLCLKSLHPHQGFRGLCWYYISLSEYHTLRMMGFAFTGFNKNNCGPDSALRWQTSWNPSWMLLYTTILQRGSLMSITLTGCQGRRNSHANQSCLAWTHEAVKECRPTFFSLLPCRTASEPAKFQPLVLQLSNNELLFIFKITDALERTQKNVRYASFSEMVVSDFRICYSFIIIGKL